MDENQTGHVMPVPPQTIPGSSPVASTGAKLPLPRPGKGLAAKSAAVWFLVAVFGAALIGGAVWGYNYFFPSPEAVMGKMMQAIDGVKTAKFDGKVAAKISYSAGMASARPVKKQEIDINFDFDGASDCTDPKNQKNELNLKISEGQFLKGDVDMNFLVFDQLIYAKVSADAKFFEYGEYNPFLNQWLEIDYAKILSGISAQYPQIAEYYQKIIADSRISPAQEAKLRAAAKKAKILVAAKKLGEEPAGGVLCRRYQYSVSKEGLREYFRAIGVIMEQQISQQQIGQMVDMIGKAEFSDIEIWIAKDDFILRRVKGSFSYKDTYSGLMAYSARFDFDYSYKDINLPVTIKAPSKSKPIIDIFGESLVLARSKARDAKRQSDMHQMFSAQGLYHGANKRYYTCGAAGGDCKGRPGNYPQAIGKYLDPTQNDPLSDGAVCGKDHVYCALDNAKNKDKYCYYAKLEAGGFYTASPAGNFKKTAAPQTFDDCAKSD